MLNFSSKKKHLLFIFIIILVLQIIFLFYLKNLTYNIFYTGIKNKGFDNIIIDKISEETFNKLSLLMNKEDRNYFKLCYKKNKENIYIFNEDTKDELERIFRETLSLNYLFYEALQSKNYQSDTLGIPNSINIYSVLKDLSDEQKRQFLKLPKEKLKDYSQSQLNEFSIKAIQVEYRKLGYNINNIKSKYIKDNIINLVLIISILILITLVQFKIIREDKFNYKPITFFQSLIIFIILEKLLFDYKKDVSTFIIVIYLLLIIALIFIYYLRKKNKRLNNKLTLIENRLPLNFNLEKYCLTWIILLIVFLITNLFIYYNYTSYHMFLGVDAKVLVDNIIYYQLLIISIFIFIYLYLKIISYFVSIRPKLIVERNNVVIPVISKKKEKRRKNKKK